MKASSFSAEAALQDDAVLLTVLGCVQKTQDVDRLLVNAINHEIGKGSKNQFARAAFLAYAAHIRKLLERPGCVVEPLNR